MIKLIINQCSVGGHTMAKREASQHAQVAKIIKAKLKSFNIKCTAKSDSFSMGNSVNIRVENQPPWIMKMIEEQTDCYEYGTFDSMTDCQGFKNRDFDGPQTKYLTISNTFTDDVRKAAWLELCASQQELEGKENDEPHTVYLDGPHREGSQMLWTYLTGLDSDFCYFVKPTIKLSLSESKQEITTEVTSDYTIEEHTHSKKKTKMFICVSNEKMSKDKFSEERSRAKAWFGWYSRKWETTPGGFAFSSIKEAKQFAGIATGPDDEPKKIELISIEDNVVPLFH